MKKCTKSDTEFWLFCILANICICANIQLSRERNGTAGKVVNMYITRDREAGNEIERFATLEEAREALKQYEKQDISDGTYTEDFYEIYDNEAETIIE